MDGVDWRCFMRRLFVPLAPQRFFSVCKCVAPVFGVACLAIIGAVPGAPQRGMATYRVSPTGSDSNPGSEARPFRTIQKAANSVKPGDTVLVDDGVYTYSGPNDCYGKVVVCVSRSGAPDVRIQDFEMTGLANANGSAGGIELFDGGSHFQVIGNHIYNIGRVCTNTSNGQNGVFIEADNVMVEANLIHDVGRLAPGQQGCRPSNEYWQNHDHGIYHDGGDHVTIRNNVIYNIKQGWAIQVWPKSRAHMNIVNNTIAFGNQHKGKLGAIVMWSPSTGGMKVSDSIIANNIFYQVNTAAIWMGGESSG